jgi:hypothetical protein
LSQGLGCPFFSLFSLGTQRKEWEAAGIADCRSREKPRERRSVLGTRLFLCAATFAFKGFYVVFQMAGKQKDACMPYQA